MGGDAPVRGDSVQLATLTGRDVGEHSGEPAQEGEAEQSLGDSQPHRNTHFIPFGITELLLYPLQLI